MSLLDDVSIVVTPNGYKAGELYAVVPVPTEGSEEVTNGYFATDLSGWDNKSATSTWVSGSARIDNSTGNARAGLYQDIGLVLGNRYILTATMKLISGDANGNFQVITSTFNGSGQTVLYTGESLIIGGSSVTETIKFTHSNSDVSIQFACNTTNAVFEIDNVSVKEYTAADMDVTRATAATRVDENGLVNYAEILGSEEVTDGNFPSGTTAWSFGVGWSLGTNKASNDGTGGILRQVGAVPLNTKFKVVFTVDDYVTGDIQIKLAPVAQTITITGDGTYTTYTDGNNSANGDLQVIATSSFQGSVTNVSVKEVTRDNVPRIDYSGGGCPHILAEPMRTNELIQSNQFDTSWAQSGTLTSGQDGVGGSTDAWKFENPNSTSGLNQTDTTSGVQTVSAYFKKNSNYGVRFFMFGSVNAWAYFDLNNGVVGLTGNSTAKVESEGTDWFRCSMTFDQTNTSFYFYVTDNATSQVVGDITLQYAQLEVGSYATSVIPTTTSTVTRNQDQFTRDGISSLINSTEGVLFVEIAALANDGTNRYLTLTNGSTNERVALLFSGNTNQIRSIIFSSSQGVNVSLSTFSYDVLNFNKIAVRFKSGDFALYVNGTKVDSSTVTGEISSDTLNRLAFDVGNDTLNLFAKVKQLQVYKTALTDEQLLQLTGESGTDFYESYAEMASALTYTIQ